MKFLCEFLKLRPDLESEVLINVPLKFKNYYLVLGPERCWNMGYQMSKLEEDYQKQLNNQKVVPQDIISLVYDTFQEGILSPT